MEDCAERDLAWEDRLRRVAGLGEVLWLHGATSTQDLARIWGAKLTGTRLPALVGAHRQSAGRGQGNRKWHTLPGSLAFTLILPPDLPKRGLASGSGEPSPPSRQFSIPRELTERPPFALIAALAAALVSEEVNVQEAVKIRWPNDVYLNGRKLAGVLAEVLGSGMCLVGIGWNVNCRLDLAPADVRARATSLIAAGSAPQDLLTLLITWLERFWEQCGKWNESPQAWAEALSTRLLYWGETVSLHIGTGQEQAIVSGRLAGMDPVGALLLQNDSGLQRVVSGSLLTGSPPESGNVG